MCLIVELFLCDLEVIATGIPPTFLPSYNFHSILNKNTLSCSCVLQLPVEHQGEQELASQCSTLGEDIGPLLACMQGSLTVQQGPYSGPSEAGAATAGGGSSLKQASLKTKQKNVFLCLCSGSGLPQQYLLLFYETILWGVQCWGGLGAGLAGGGQVGGQQAHQVVHLRQGVLVAGGLTSPGLWEGAPGAGTPPGRDPGSRRCCSGGKDSSLEFSWAHTRCPCQNITGGLPPAGPLV